MSEYGLSQGYIHVDEPMVEEIGVTEIFGRIEHVRPDEQGQKGYVTYKDAQYLCRWIDKKGWVLVLE